MITTSAAFIIVVEFGSVLLGGWLLSSYLLSVYSTRRTKLDRIFGPVERAIYYLGGVNPYEEMGWKAYLRAVLALNAVEAVIGFVLLLFQGSLPLNTAIPTESPVAAEVN